METKKTILIADTSEEFRTVLAEAIQAEEGLEVVGQTGDGQEAIQLVQDRDPDVLVMDLVLERMDGFDDITKGSPLWTTLIKIKSSKSFAMCSDIPSMSPVIDKLEVIAFCQYSDKLSSYIADTHFQMWQIKNFLQH